MPKHAKRQRTLAVLEKAGILGPGTVLIVHPGHLDGPWPETLGELGRRATLGDRLSARANVIWALDGEQYSLTELRNRLFDGGAPFTSGLTYEHWALEGAPEKSLWDLAEEIGR